MKGDRKVSDEVLEPLFANVFAALGLENLVRKRRCPRPMDRVPLDTIDAEVLEVLARIAATAERAGGAEAPS